MENNVETARTIEQEGRNSYYAGFSKGNNPHHHGTRANRRWLNGFNEEKADPRAAVVK
jgi:hypothetical protein